MVSENETVNEFREALRNHELSTNDQIIGDGKLHRFHVEGDSRGKLNGWYVLHIDERPAGSFGSWKTNQSETWTANIQTKLTAKQKQELEKRISEQRKIRDEEEKRIQEQAAARASEIWQQSQPALDFDHPYLERKSINAHSIRISRGNLVIPIRDQTGKLWSLQFIKPDGEKRYLSGGKKNGCYFTIAKSKPSENETICICEGFATGATIFQATQFPTVIAFDAGNLHMVSKIIREKFSRAKIIVCADDDRYTPGNPGISAAKEAAQKIDGYIAIPQFKNQSETNKITDFNDLAESEGISIVAEQIKAVDDTEKKEIIIIEQNSSIPAFKFNIFDWPMMNGKGKPLSSIENLEHLLDMNGIKVRYDVIRKDMQILIPGESYLVDTERNDKITRIISLASTARMPRGQIPEFVAHIAGQNPYNPVAEWILSKPWDGISRLQSFYDTVKAEGDDDQVRRIFKETILKRWMISAIAAAFRPNGVSAHGILVFKGDQYIGKTNWFKTLVPQDLKFTRDGMLLDPKDKDSVYQIVSNWIVELGEIDATFRKADIAQLKAFITKHEDTIRLPYARSTSSFARKTVFFASVNDETFLSDPTGNRRFWTIDCISLAHNHDLNMQQIWSEFYELYQKGESWYLSPDEMAHLNIHNRDYEVINPIEELIATRFDWSEPRALWVPKTATDIADSLGIRDLNSSALKQIGRAIRDVSKQKRHRSNGRSLYFVPKQKFQN